VPVIEQLRVLTDNQIEEMKVNLPSNIGAMISFFSTEKLEEMHPDIRYFEKLKELTNKLDSLVDCMKEFQP